MTWNLVADIQSSDSDLSCLVQNKFHQIKPCQPHNVDVMEKMYQEALINFSFETKINYR